MNQTYDDISKEMDSRSLKLDIQRHLRYTLAKSQFSTTKWDKFRSVALTALDRLHDRWIDTQEFYYESDSKRVYYISMEFLMGRLLDNMLVNLDILDEVKEALHELGIDYELVREQEFDAGLGNGGLGRLAACFLDSMATLGVPGYGYGIRYDFGIFQQQIKNGFQIEKPDTWLMFGNPWDVVRPKVFYPVNFYGESVPYTDSSGQVRFKWVNTQKVNALAYDSPVPGYNNDIVNHLRLWKASASKAIDLQSFSQGEYINAVRDAQLQENISRVLYPNDKVFVGQELRLKQEYFLVSATLQDIIRRFKKIHNDWTTFPDKVAIQCNDTHPNLAIPELMRVLIDEEGLDWEKSWDITRKAINYTNHTVLPEALEKWPVSLMRNLLPRHLQIIYEINKRFLDTVSVKLDNDVNRARRMSIISEGERASVQMATLGIVGSSKVNGVARLHTELIKKTIFKDFYELYPDKFVNMTNGITPRRWLKQCNPRLSDLISEHIGDKWITDLDELRKLDDKATDPEFRNKFADIKYQNKMDLVRFIEKKFNKTLNPDSIFDIQIKRIHEYKRQVLVALHTAMLYNRIKANPDAPFVPRTVLFGGKAAPGYTMAKLHIKLINSIAEKINNDPDTRDKLSCLFLENYSVSMAERLIPAADLSEQTSTAGMEASGTGNMKFALNGALTIGTLDGANIEIREEVGKENIFIFGLTDEEVDQKRREGYNPWEYYEQIPELKEVIDQINQGFYEPGQPDLFHPITRSLLDDGDYFMVMADFEAYAKQQKEVEKLYSNKDEWMTKAIYNVTRIGKFSSDRTIQDYCEQIWNVGFIDFDAFKKYRSP
ncbi:glycogen/starch/alpha-glucan phosphorylase [Balneolaceae bacterium ANBcel3]|nr:glycogen/starch/alpha-glucan phosphorylase [Balneolaceae bacterium ANBcel3]